MDQLDISREAIKMLKYVKSHTVDDTDLCYKFGETAEIALNDLELQHLVDYNFDGSGHSATLFVTDEGQYFLKHHRAEQFSALKRSVLIPIFVTLATNGIIALSKQLFPLLQGLFSNSP